MKNPQLQQIEARIEKGLKDDVERQFFTRLVAAGKKALYDDEKTFNVLSESVAKSPDPISELAKGMTAIVNLLAKKARGTIPHPVAVMAGMSLLLDALDFAEEAGLFKLDADSIGKATQVYIDSMAPSLGLTSQKVGGALGSLDQAVNNPERMGAVEKLVGGA